MTTWMILQCVYVIGGGLVTKALLSAVFARTKAWGEIGEPLPAFALIVGILVVRPVVLLLIVEGGCE